jgi:hypothetical protein
VPLPAGEGRPSDHHGVVPHIDRRAPPALLRAADRPAAGALAGFLFALVVVSVQLARAGGDVSAFVRAAPPWADARAAPAELRVGEHGYDGMFYWRLARDPFTDRATDHGVTLDLPAYRQQRILYPLLAWAVSAGDAQRTAAALVAVNVAAVTALGWIGAVAARRAGRHALWGALFAAQPGAVVTLSADLTEAVAAALVLAGAVLLRAGRSGGAGAALALAALARETTALFTLASAATTALRAPGRLRVAAPLAIPLLVLLAWQAFLAARWGGPAAGQAGPAFDPPFLGLLAAAWLNAERLEGGTALVWGASLAFVLATVVIGARSLRTALPHERAAWLGYLALATVLEANIWANEAMLRTTTELSVLTGLLALGAGRAERSALLALGLGASGLLLAAGIR